MCCWSFGIKKSKCEDVSEKITYTRENISTQIPICNKQENITYTRETVIPRQFLGNS